MLYNYVTVIGSEFPGLEVSCYGDPTVYSNIDWGSNTPIDQATLDTELLDMKQKDVWAAIKNKRDDTKYGGALIASLNKYIHSDDASRIQQIGLVMMGANIPANLMWKLMDNTYVQMTQTLANEIFQTVANNDSNIFSIAENHRQNMLAAADPLSYDYSSGWPLTYVESPGYVAP